MNARTRHTESARDQILFLLYFVSCLNTAQQSYACNNRCMKSRSTGEANSCFLLISRRRSWVVLVKGFCSVACVRSFLSQQMAGLFNLIQIAHTYKNKTSWVINSTFDSDWQVQISGKSDYRVLPASVSRWHSSRLFSCLFFFLSFFFKLWVKNCHWTNKGKCDSIPSLNLMSRVVYFYLSCSGCLARRPLTSDHELQRLLV